MLDHFASRAEGSPKRLLLTALVTVALASPWVFLLLLLPLRRSFCPSRLPCREDSLSGVAVLRVVASLRAFLQSW
jgi:hypothetical protein